MKSHAQNKETNHDEQKLVAQVSSRKKGWQDAFSKLITHHQGYLYQRCLARLGNPADAEDVFQEVLFSAYRYLPGFEGRSSLRTWLTRIADNHCTAHQRKQQRYILTDHIEALIELHESIPDLQEQELISNQVNELMEALPIGAQTILRLRYWSDMSVEDISRTLDLGRSAAKMRAHRALQQCRHILAAESRLAT